MPVLRIEHTAPDFDEWKKSFDNDPLDRKGSGVRRYQVMRQADEPDCVMVDLEFDTLAEAKALLAALQELWGRIQAEGVIASPQARIVEIVESAEL